MLSPLGSDWTRYSRVDGSPPFSHTEEVMANLTSPLADSSQAATLGGLLLVLVLT